VDSKVSSNEMRIDENEIKIEDMESSMNNMTTLNVAPIGTISAWVTKPTKDTGDEDAIVDLPDGWVRCNGNTIPHPSIWAGKITPNLNGEKRFLRGALDSEELTLEEDQMQDHKHKVSDPGHTHGYNDKYTFNGGGGYGPEDGKGTFDYDHDRTSDSSHTGITVDGVSSGYRFGSETRPKNMNVIYIMRVW